ncbi:L,D-transpeptidase family protein [Rhizobium sp. 9140]|uniref:L,D-transpeptidase family protein n=1 Tax=Rhizobium sp. 9140 TaxID=1761900 RepID=UPI000B85D96A|nr:L,D-transpeptidase family protein [Rhizobium sp. 9140]
MRKILSKPRSSPGTITVRAAPGRRYHALVSFSGRTEQAAIGRGGMTARKREGDGATPIAAMPLIDGYIRADRVVPPATRLFLKRTRTDMLWCDAPDHACYNRPVSAPFAGRYETMMRSDGLYDICLVMDWNMRVRRRNAGSAIFFHLIRPGYQPTEGCVAVSLLAMRRILAFARKGTVVNVLG